MAGGWLKELGRAIGSVTVVGEGLGKPFAESETVAGVRDPSVEAPSVKGFEFLKQIQSRVFGMQSGEEVIILFGVMKVGEPLLKIEADLIQLIGGG